MCNRLIQLFIVSLIFVSCSGEEKAQPGNNEESGKSAGAESSQNTNDTSKQKHWILSVPFQKIEKGSFKMGSPADESGRHSDEDQVNVEISRSFEIMTKEVTQSQWLRVMGNNPSYFKEAKHCNDHKDDMCPNHPVEKVSWNDVQEFIKKLNTALKLADCNGTPSSKKGCYRLPTEAEWEYAARGGTTTAYSFGADSSQLADYAWYKDNSEGRTHKVGLKKPNPKGLYDVHGNVWEWVQDKRANELPGGKDPLHTSGVYRVLRGGGWSSGASYFRSARRSYSFPSIWSYIAGFRLVRTL